MKKMGAWIAHSMFVLTIAASPTTVSAHDDDSHRLFDLDGFSLESGTVLPNARLSFVTHGTLNADKSNAILTPSAYSGDHHEYDFLIGPGRALDTDKYFVIATDMFAGGLSSSPSNTPAPFDGPRFPAISTRDNVDASYKLVTEEFGIERLHAVVGFSMGAQQALQWAVSFPDYISKAVPFCGSAKEYPHGVARLEGFKSALTADAAFNNGEYVEPPIKGLTAGAVHWSGWGFSQEWYRQEQYKQFGQQNVEDHIEQFWVPILINKDANDLLSQAITWQTNNVGNTLGFDGDHVAALNSIRARVQYIACETDMYFHIAALEDEASLIPGAEFVVLPSLAGHVAGGGVSEKDQTFLNENIGAFLDLDDYSELDIDALQSMMESGKLTAEKLVRFYIHRIGKIDASGPTLNSIIEVNPDALSIARALDEERKTSGPRSGMHGIPVVLKANIDTADKMETTAGSLALDGHIPPRDAFLVERLREAGAIILAKANLSEWANFRSSNSVSGWSSVGGQTHNPYDTSRNPCGSSSGSGVSVSANLTAVAIGTETDGSVVCPASINGIVGIKPTLGLVSRSGIIPIAHSQDTAGPMARTVKDAALLMNAMVGHDAEDPLADEYPDDVADFAANLTSDALRGARIGVIRNFGGAGSNARVESIFESSIDKLRLLGAEIVDDIELETEGMNDAERQVLLYEYKAGLAAYFERSEAPVRSLAEVIEFNNENADRVMPIFQQEIMEAAEEKGPLTETEYLEALETSKRISQAAINDVLAEHDLDALVAPSNSPSWLTDHVNGDTFDGIFTSSYAAISGYPAITVPSGFISGLPVSLSFIGGAFTDDELIRFAYAFEQATNARRRPPVDWGMK